MAKQQGASGDDILLNVRVTGREQISETRTEAKGLKSELDQGGKVDLAKPAQTLKAKLKEAILEAQRLANAGKENTVEFRKAAQNVAEIRDRIEQLNRTFEAFDPDNKFKIFSSVAASGAKIVQGYAGAMAFLGVNSKDAAETIAKLQGIMAFTDAISSLADIQDSYKDLLTLLGLNVAKTEEVAASQAEVAVATQTSSEIQIEAEQAVAIARQAVADTSIASEQAVIAVREEGLVATTEMTVAERAYLETAAARALAVEQLTAAELALAEARVTNIAASEEQAVATAGVTVAEEGATVAATGLGTALKLIGIGLIVSAIAYLITNFDKVKKVVADLFPGLAKTGTILNTIKEIAYGVGNVILQYLVAPIKILIDLVKGDFSGALQELKNGFNVVKNFKDGVAAADRAIAEQARIDRVNKEIEANERIIKERKALGENTTKLEVENNRLKISVLDKDNEDYAKTRADLETETTVILNAEYKRQNDIYKAKLKADLDAIKANNIAASKIVRDGLTANRAAEITDIDLKYNAELELLNRRRDANKKYNDDYNNLVSARKIEEQRVNKKYDDAIDAYSKEINQTYFSEFEKKEAEIKKRAEELLKNATPKQAADILSGEAFQLSRNEEESIATSASNAAKTALTKSENSNRPSDSDTPEEARLKVDNLAKSKLDAEQKAYELRRLQLQGHYDELAQLDADHETAKTNIEREQADARQQIAAAELEARLRMFDALGAGASAASDLLGENTLAGKALAVAAATISTYTAIAGQLAAFSKVPIPGYAIAQAIATGLVGLAQVKKILTVKVPSKSGGSGAGGVSAPVVNSTVLQQANAGTRDVVDAVNTKSDNKPLKAYIVNKDLNDQKAKDSYYQSQSEY